MKTRASDSYIDTVHQVMNKKDLIEERRKVCAAIMANYQKLAEANESNDKLEQRLFEIEEQIKLSIVQKD